MATITYKDNHLVFDKDAITMLDLKADDRIEIRYWNESPTVTYPVVGHIDAFGDCEGRRVTKKLTVSFRGQQAQVLAIYGTSFSLEKMDGAKFFKMTPIKENIEETYVKEAEDALESINELSQTEEFDW